jgi:hypothetical protein
MASPGLVVRAGVGSWTSIKYLLTRGLDIGTPAVLTDVISLRHSSSPRVIRQSESTFDARRSTSPLRTRLSES